MLPLSLCDVLYMIGGGPCLGDALPLAFIDERGHAVPRAFPVPVPMLARFASSDRDKQERLLPVHGRYF